MAPKRVLSEAEQVKRRQTSREFRANKKKTDPNWHAKEALRISEYYIPKSRCTKKSWKAYKTLKNEGMKRYRHKQGEMGTKSSKRRTRSSRKTPPESQGLPVRTRTTRNPTNVDARKRIIVQLPAVVNRCRALKRKLKQAEMENKTLTAKMTKVERKMFKEKTPEQISSTPVREAHQLLQDAGVTPRPSVVNKIVPYTATAQAVRDAPPHVKRNLMSTSTNRKGLAKPMGRIVNMSRKTIFKRKRSRYLRMLISASKKNIVVSFLKRPDNSSQLPGKKDNVLGQVRFGLTDTMNNLFAKFRQEYPELTVSQSVFFAARPSYIKLIQWTKRKQCLCQTCANMCLRIHATKVLPKSGQAVCDMLDSEIEAKIEGIQPNIAFKQWCRVDISHKGKQIKKTKLIDVSLSKDHFKFQFMEKLKDYRQHCGRVETQYRQLRVLKQRMTPMLEATVQFDYAENWRCGYQNEISAVYYDQNMITLHPMVVHYWDEDGNLKHISYVGVTDEGKHCAPTTYTFMKAFIPDLRCHLPNLRVLHYITDSPSSQYRNRTIAAIVSLHSLLFNIKASWTYLETGHGKGPCDGVGGAIKKMADNAVKTGKTVTNAENFCQVLGEKMSKMILLKVSPDAIEQSRNEIASWDIVPCGGIGRAHAVWPVGNLMIRETTCFEESCYDAGGLFHPSCPGWQRTNVQVFEAIPDGEMNVAPKEVTLETVTMATTPEGGKSEVTATGLTQKTCEPAVLEAVMSPEGTSKPLCNDDETSNLKVDDFVIAVSGNRWYVAKVTDVLDSDIALTFMTPVRSKWKWGQRDEGTFDKECILLKVNAPHKFGKSVLDITPRERVRAQELYAMYTGER